MLFKRLLSAMYFTISAHLFCLIIFSKVNIIAFFFKFCKVFIRLGKFGFWHSIMGQLKFSPQLELLQCCHFLQFFYLFSTLSSATVVTSWDSLSLRAAVLWFLQVKCFSKLFFLITLVPSTYALDWLINLTEPLNFDNRLCFSIFWRIPSMFCKRFWLLCQIHWLQNQGNKSPSLWLFYSSPYL